MCKKLFYFVSLALVIGLVNTTTAELVGHWRFDEGSGDAVNDSSGNGNNGTIVDSVQWDTGQIGGALRFDGTPGYVLIPNPGNLTLINQGDFTITMWFSQDVIEGTINLLQQTDLNGTGRTLLLSDPTNGIRAYLGGQTTVSGVMAEAETWYHVAMVVTEGGSEDTITFYIDGVQSGTPAQVDSEDSEGDYLIATNKGLNGRWINGLVDDFRLYNHALSEAEVLGVMGGADSYPYALGPDPADGAMIEDTWVILSWSPGDFALSHDVYLGENFDDVNTGAESTFLGNQTTTLVTVGFPGFAYPDGLVPGTTYYWRIDEVNDTEPNSPWKGNIWSFSVPPKTAYFPDPADSAESVSVNVELSWTGGFGAKLHHVYFGETFDEVDNATGALPQGAATYTPPGTLKMAKTYYWRVDEFDVVETYKGNVWSFTTEGAVVALDPANGDVDVTQTPVLTWTPGLGASYEVYFGTDASSLELKASGSLGSESYDAGQLEWNTTYYWRVDEANSTNADSPWTGPTWSFTTANFLIIDDMEAYNDINEGEEGSNRIYNAWVDGYDDPTNGSQTGHLDVPFYEETIVHGGDKSLPLYYDNAVGKSEATLALTSNRDWTVNGVDTLTIWFRGSADNAAETMYVTLNGSASVDNDNPDAAMRTSWTQWNIPLQAFADQGVNLANVTSITIGLRSVTGGTGTMYFDDIRLYPPEPEIP
ncbi:MAG: LamG domain-containing protein [Planctomycetota bacterium]|jgi:hypothetical protein